MDLSQYLELFIEESKEHLESLNTSLLEMEQTPDNEELVNEIFRVAHTLKGMAATMGFKKMSVLTHDMENVLTEIRNGNVAVSPELNDVLFRCLDALENYVDNIVEEGNEGNNEYKEIIKDLNSLIDGKVKKVVKSKKEETKPVEEVKSEKSKHLMLAFNEFEKDTMREGYKEGYDTVGITVYVADSCVLKSARAFIVFRELEEMGTIIKAYPTVTDIEDEKFEAEFSVYLLTKVNKEQVIERLSNIAEIEKVTADVMELKDIERMSEEVSDEKNEETEKLEKESLIEISNKDDSKKNENNKKKISKHKANRTVRVDIERLDNLMNLVSELIIAKNGLEAADNTESASLNEQIEYLERITTNLHDAVMKVRMVPVERVFNRFPRLIRDLSRKLDKDMVLHMTGEETELDRTVIDEIGDPLVHLIRNSCDHGIETKEERKKTIKNAQGKVFLEAYQDGNNVVIEVRDDGRGIDVDKVRKKAIEKGNITQEQSEAMSSKDIIDLLFKPSFSTADQVSDVSGRGVGLDVVKTKIEALGGDIEVTTELGKGSKFVIRLPLTLAIIQALMVTLGNEKYAIPLNTIQNIEDVKVSEIEYVQNEKVITLRGSVIPIIDLKEKLSVKKEENEVDSITVVIINKGEKLAGLVVDGMVGQQEIVIKSLGRYLTNNKLIAGATILGNGEVALILDVNSLI